VSIDESRALAVRGPEVAHDTIDDESVIVDLDTGTYYSLRGAAAQVWMWAAAGASVESLVDTAIRSYTAPADEVGSSVRDVLAQLLEASLLVVTDAPPQPVDPLGGASFVAPSFEAFRDLEELLTLDPIHDVDATGWPNAATES
jgi:hypothetical protein